MNRPVVTEMSTFLSEEWPNEIAFDVDEANETGVVVFVWAATKIPLPISIEITDEALESGRIIRRELKQKIKDCLATNLIRARISEANSMLRGANRKDLRVVEKTFKSWREETAEDIKKSLGYEPAQTFLSDVSLPTGVRSSSIQALQFLVESKIDCLKNIEC